MNTIRGKVIVLYDDIDTDQILPGYAMAEPYESLGNYAMAGLVGYNWRTVFEPGNIIVAGRNFGCGSSREQAPTALKQSGVALIVAKGFARIFRRNSINIGLPVFTADLSGKVKTGDWIDVDLEKGEIVTDKEKLFFDPIAPSVLKTLEYGGLIPRIRVELGIQ